MPISSRVSSSAQSSTTTAMFSRRVGSAGELAERPFDELLEVLAADPFHGADGPPADGVPYSPRTRSTPMTSFTAAIAPMTPWS